ncbi:hypothetical protein CAPTEDRAFT_200317 [Capitella teleta]|uniref:Uncharacterized protein n=1 Tax=Capitella teleta TaxID=283909 RepID=R7UZS1_CAPTE|nr:hypothetical protein CAPTEDRAFT_200317 [Capitella teleta]|eukprot:ELU09452.1 hypothetical protein CAPTEDRAFT_200317 [Capitella teleta]
MDSHATVDEHVKGISSGPFAVSRIGEVLVDRSHPLFQYALFCMTRYAQEFQKLLFDQYSDLEDISRQSEDDYLAVIQEVFQDLDHSERLMPSQYVSGIVESAAKDSISELAYRYLIISEHVDQYSDLEDISRQSEDDYLAVIQEVFQDLDHSERLMPSQYVSGIVESTAKDSISELAYRYLIISEHVLQNMMPPNDHEIAESYKDIDVETIDIFSVFYEDIVRVLVNDMDRKQIWNPSTLHTNQRFKEYLKLKEPEAFEKLLKTT